MAPAHDPHRYRSLFPVCDRRVYLNHAGVSPTPAPVARAVNEWFVDLSQNGLRERSPWETDIDAVRAKAARLIGARASEISFIRSTSHGLCLVAEGLDWRPGDEVICAPSLEYPSNVYPWTRLTDRGVVVRAVDTKDSAGRGQQAPTKSGSEGSGGVTAAAVESLMTDRTRVVAVSTVQFATGHRTDVAALSALCAERGVHLVLDAIQSLGAFPIDVGQTPVAALAACSHKWLLGVLGTGIAYVSSELAPSLRPPLVGWRSTRDPWAWDGDRFELPDDGTRFEEGTLPGALIAGLGAALDLLLEIGIDAIAAHISGLLDQLEARVAPLGCTLSPPRSERAGIGMLSPPPGADAEALCRTLCAAGFAVVVRRGRIRVAPHLYNTADEIERLGAAISAAL